MIDSITKNSWLKKHWPELTVFTLSLALYLPMASQSVVPGDTGEFLASAAVGGVPHAPGYPLYSVLSRIMYLLPLGNPAWQVNALSGIFSSIAVVFAYKIIFLLTKQKSSAFFGSIALLVYEYFWYYSLVAEMLTLQVLISLIILYFLVRAVLTKKISDLLIASLAVGFGVTNNHTTLFLIPSFAIACWTLRKHLTPKHIGGFFLLAGLPLMLYGYTIWSAGRQTVINWGNIHDLQSFLNMFFRRDFGSFLLGKPEPPAPIAYHSFVYYWKSLLITSWMIIPFSIVSVLFYRRQKVAYWMLLIYFLLIGPVYYLLANIPVRSVVHEANLTQYVMYSFAVLSIFAGLGFSVVKEKLNLKSSWVAPALIAAILLPAAFFTYSKVMMNNITNVATETMLNQVPKNGIILAWSDSFYMPSLYTQRMMRQREDVPIVQMALISTPWYKGELEKQYPGISSYLLEGTVNYQKICDQLVPKRDVFIYPWYPEFDIAFPNCRIIPYGLLNKVVRKDSVPPLQEIKEYNDKVWGQFIKEVKPEEYRTKTARTRESLFYLSEQLHFLGQYFQDAKKNDWALETFSLSNNISSDQTNSAINQSSIFYAEKENQKAIDALEEGVRRNPTTQALYKNLGVIYLQMQNREKAYHNFKRYMEFDPQDPDSPGITNFISQYEAGM